MDTVCFNNPCYSTRLLRGIWKVPAYIGVMANYYALMGCIYICMYILGLYRDTGKNGSYHITLLRHGDYEHETQVEEDRDA